MQPPVHATAALAGVRARGRPERAAAFLAELLPRLDAWHGYLYRERNRFGDGLIEIWHPWESGWTTRRSGTPRSTGSHSTADDVPEYKRVDVNVIDPEQRPTNAEYDRYAYFVKLYRDCAYESACIRGRRAPSSMHDVLFNSLLVQANRDLAEIADVLG